MSGFRKVVNDPTISNEFPSETDIERLAIEAEEPFETFVDFAPGFLAVEDPPVRYLIKELLPAEIIALTHGEPRTRKSWALLEIAIALTSGKPAFGLQRFAVSETVPVLYCSQEDSARPVRDRMKRLLRGYGIPIPEKLAFAVHKGINLDNPAWHARMLADVSTHQFRVVILDPVRRFSEQVDKGPAEVRRLTAYLRRLCIETGATVIANHHDVKPSSEKADTRRRSHKASGGDWFAASECPIAFEPAGENCSLVIPEDYKFSMDPKPFTFRIEENTDRTWARLVGEDSTAEQAQDLAAQSKILDFLGEHTGASGSAIAKALKLRKDGVLTTLLDLEKSGKIDSVKAEKKGKATTWFLKREAAE